MAETMMRGGIQLDHRMVRTVDIGVVETRRIDKVADVGERGVEFRAGIELLLICGRHIFSAPAEMPDGRSDLRRWRCRDLIEQNPRLLRPDAVPRACEFGPLAIELAGVEIDGGGRIGRVQVDVMEVSWRILLRECRKGDE